ncbi:MAG: nucleotidyl transferase AbiEii/AbiGii toxin family protein, partial [Betaproteobacteria bacterium]
MITHDNPYAAQVRLLVNVLPFVTRESCFALKGGTAINLFVRDMPRLSVDIDLAFLPLTDRPTALQESDAAFARIQTALQSVSPPFSVQVAKREDGKTVRLLIADPGATIKIEVSPVLRGTVYPETMRSITHTAETLFGFAEVRSLSFEDPYAGKIVAALDRQHPRDLFDTKILLEHEGVSEKLFRAFLVYLISHSDSLARVIHPRAKPLKDLYEKQFRNMSAIDVSLEDLETARSNLVQTLHAHIDGSTREFLLSFKRGQPKWDLLGVEHAPDLPAVKWKLHNLSLLSPAKRKLAVAELERV